MNDLGSNPQSEIKTQKSEMARRDFLALFGRGALWATAGATVVALLRYLSFTEPTPPQVFVLNEPSAYPPGTTTSVADSRAFIKHDERGLYAINATCTHLGCLVRQAQAGFECPCHGSRFAANGAVTTGPATAPLNYAALSIDSEGKVVVDLSQTVGAEVRLPIA
jgi:cytochrome b6-f complex iron-sulfur subunit